VFANSNKLNLPSGSYFNQKFELFIYLMYFTSRYERKIASPNYSAIFFSTYTQVSPSLKPFSTNSGKDIGLHQAYAV